MEENREDYESNYHQNECSYKHQIEKLKKENTMLREENHKHMQNVRNASGNEIIGKLKDLEEKNDSLGRMLAQKERTSREEIDHKDEMIRTLESANRDLSRQIDKEKLNCREANNERTQLKYKISGLEKDKECLEDENARLKRSVESKAHTVS